MKRTEQDSLILAQSPRYLKPVIYMDQALTHTKESMKHVYFTLLDIACDFMIRFFLGVFASSMVPASIIAIFFSLFMMYKRKTTDTSKQLTDGRKIIELESKYIKVVPQEQ
jgi:Na+/H+-dicarboxylate symporter